MGESQAGICERPGASLDQGGLNSRNFSKRKRENRGTQRLFRELSTAAMPIPLLPPQPLDCECAISSPSTHLNPGWRSPRSADWAPKLKSQEGAHTDQSLGCPQLKSWVGAHPDQWLGCPSTQTQSWGSVCTQISGLAVGVHRPKAPGWTCTSIKGLGAHI